MGPEGFSKIGAGKDTLPALPVIFQIGAGMVGPEWYRAGTSETRLCVSAHFVPDIKRSKFKTFEHFLTTSSISLHQFSLLSSVMPSILIYFCTWMLTPSIL
jgi:hypothetical protein